MSLRLAAALLAVVTAAEARAATFRETSMPLPDGSTLLYAISLPDDFKPGEPRPLILALHPGGERMRYYGAAYARMMVAPAAAGLRAIIVAPDCPTRSWIDPAADRAVKALLEAVMREHAVDRKRVLVTGYSLGGRGTWFMASHHPDLFTAAVPMAAAIGDEPLDRLATMPTYIVHSRDDEVVPFAPAERTARALAKMGRPVKFEALWKLTHFQMDLYVPSLRRAMRWISERW